MIKNEVPSGTLFQLFLGILQTDQTGIENVTTFILGKGKDEDHTEKINKWDIDAITEGAVLTVEGSENAPDGMRSINFSCLCPYDHPENWFLNGHNKETYNAFKKEIAEKLLENMCRYIPDLKNRIVISNTATPLTMYRYTRATKGGLQGSAHIVSQSGNNRGALKSPISHLYRAGQYVFPGAGIITVTMSGKLCADLIVNQQS